MEVLDKVKSLIKEHIVLAISVLICFVLMILGNSISGSAKADYLVVHNQLTNVNNKIINISTKNQEVEYVVKPLENGLDKARWAADDIIITEWIYPAFNFEGATEYNTNRDLYVTRLGSSDDFVINIMPPYISGYTTMNSESSEVNNGNTINMSISSFKSYVDKIDGDNYSYVAVVSCSSTANTGGSGASTVILTYTISGNGSVVKFAAATPSTIKTQ